MDRDFIRLLIEEYLEFTGYSKTLNAFDNEIPDPPKDGTLMTNLEKLIALGLSCDVSESLKTVMQKKSLDSDPKNLPLLTNLPNQETEILDAELVNTDIFDSVFPSSGVKDGVYSVFGDELDSNQKDEYFDALDDGFVEVVPTTDVLITQTRFCDLCEMVISEAQLSE